jgi:hypothetical protein
MSPHLQLAFQKGELIRPSAVEVPDLVHVTRALATLAGVPDLNHTSPTTTLLELIRPADHLVFILLDGLGMNLLSRVPKSTFLASHLRRQINSICPSTTAAALTSVATGNWPAAHAVTGWFTHLPEFNLTATVLPFVDRFSGQSLAQRGLATSDVLPVSAFHPRMTHRPLTLLPRPISHTTYANYSRGDTPGLSYDNIPHAVDQIIAHVGRAPEPTYTHLYIPDIDTACHHHGTRDERVFTLIAQIDAQLARLHDALGHRARIVIVADHGLLDVPVVNHISLFHDDPLMAMLQCPPSGDARLPLFHTKPDYRRAFADLFTIRYGDRFELLSIDEVDELRFLGPAPLSPVARRRFGDFVAIAYEPVTLHYVPPVPSPPPVDPKPKAAYLAQHAGLSAAEMRIPLIIA